MFLWRILVGWLAFLNPFNGHVGPKPVEEIAQAAAALHGDLYGGDMIFDEGAPPDAGIRDTRYRWPGYPGKGIVPYVIHPSMAKHKALILKAMDQYHSLTCIKFVPWTDESNYIGIVKGYGCSSYVGYNQIGVQLVRLGPGCEYLGTIVHELGHAIGLYHEHQRSDRDKYVTIYKGNVTNGEFHNFDKTDKSEELIYTTYDYSSIMHDGNYAFSKSPKRLMSMEAKNGQELLDPRDKPGLTDRDVDMINKLYKCK